MYLAPKKFNVLPHTSYCPNLALCDFWLFLKLKEQLGNQTFSINEDIILACDQIFTHSPTTEFAKTFQNQSNVGSGALKSMVAFLKKKFCKE